MKTERQCQKCGNCCQGLGLPPFLDSPEAEILAVMPPELRAEVLATPYTEAANGRPCSWFDPATNQCRHYEFRPVVCRKHRCAGGLLALLRL